MTDIIVDYVLKLIQWCADNPGDVYSYIQIADFMWRKIAPKRCNKDKEPPATKQEDSSDKQQHDKH